jgi:hypothetical protein
MAIFSNIESKPGVVFLSQIVVSEKNVSNSEMGVKEVIESLAKWGFNFALPIICLTDEDDKYRLLTGLSIYESACASGIDKIWAVLIAAKQPEAEQFIDQALLQSKLNDRVIEPQDVTEFLEFINNGKSDLTKISGVGTNYAKLISDKRPYASQEDMQKKLGAKRSLNWLKSYKQKKS